uniref:Chemokine interleukin-8-like domain-containing protein n=1 Tax=Leptobrachium leishanense TaxID=445787 RepID=A0A8C5M814_9ANUR
MRNVGKISSCCTRVSANKIKETVVEFLIQKEDLPCVEAVIFITENGKIHCSRPNLPWVAHKMKEIM